MVTREERSNWRDKKLDNILKENHVNLIDSFLLTEYNYGKSVAIIEYKRTGSGVEANKSLLNYCKSRKNNEYYFIVLYDYEMIGSKCRLTKIIICPKNDVAIRRYGSEPKEVNELQFIDFLYDIRNGTSSKYREKAHQEYEEWFILKRVAGNDHQVISNRHRSYAYDVPAADIDCMLCDKENRPYLFIEYKHNFNIGTKRSGGHNPFIYENVSQETLCLHEEKSKALYNKAIADLGDGCKEPIPVLAVEYNLEHKIFSLYAFNKCAGDIALLGTMTQGEYFDYIKEPKNFRKKEIKTSIHICQRCGSQMEVKNGIYGEFYGCKDFKINHCRYTEPKKNNILSGK